MLSKQSSLASTSLLKMFSKNQFGNSGSRRLLFGRNKNSSSKKQSSKQSWIEGNKQRNEQKEKPRLEPLLNTNDTDVMTSSEPSPTLQASMSPTQYPELPDEPRPGKIRPSTPTTSNNTTTNSSLSPSPRAGTNSTSSFLGNNNRSTGGASGSGADSPEVEAIKEAVPVILSILPSPEPQPLIERNGYKGSALKLDNNDKVDGDIKFKHPHRDVDEDSCTVKCIYFTQQCCECTII